MKKTKKSRPAPAPPATAAYQHFGMKTDPFTTLSLQAHNLDYFVGRKELIDRLSSNMLSLSNVGVAGEPGVGKSSLMQLLRSRLPKDFFSVVIGVPLDDASYFLSELLREVLVAIPKVPGLKLGEVARRVEKETLSKNTIFSILKTLIAHLKKPLVVFVDDLEKTKGDRVRHFTRSERTLQLLEELKPILELPKVGFVVILQEEFYSMVGQIVKEGAEPTVLGLFKNIVFVERFTRAELQEALAIRLRQAGFGGSQEEFLEPEALSMALSFSYGNPRRFLFLISEGMYRSFRRRSRRVEFQDLFDAVNEHLKLDLICKKLLFFLAKSGRAAATNADLQSFMGRDMITIARRLETLAKNRLAELVDVVNGTKVYALPGTQIIAPKAVAVNRDPTLQTEPGEKVYFLDGDNALKE